MQTNLQPDVSVQSDIDMTFSGQHSWMVQCLSLATLGLLTYLHIAPMVA
jgi:hypothetical protein